VVARGVSTAQTQAVRVAMAAAFSHAGAHGTGSRRRLRSCSAAMLGAAWHSPLGSHTMAAIKVPCNTVRGVVDRAGAYRPLDVARLGHLLADAEDALRWRLIAEFLEEYRWEPSPARLALLAEEPDSTGDERWDVFLAALAEHLAARDGRGAPAWSESRSLRRLWFPFNTRAARVDAVVHAPAAFRRRGVYVAAQELEVA
jgi:hypothetical protein